MRPKLVFLPNWVGDFLMAMAYLGDLALEGKVLLFGKARFFELVRGALPPGVWMDRGRSFLEDWWNLFRSPAVEAVLLPNSFYSALVSTLAGMKCTGVVSDGRGFLLTRRVFLDRDRIVHQAEIYRMVLAKALLEVPEKPDPFIHLADEDLEWAKERLRRLGWEGERMLIVHPGASKPERCWPADRFREVVARALRRGWVVALVGGGSDAKIAERVCDGLGDGCFNLAEENPPLGRLAAFISQGDLFLGNDSGPLHIAAALGLDCVGIYGTSVPEKTGPLLAEGARFVPVASRFPCSPCRERFFKECEPVGGIPPCIDAIGVEEVWEALESLM